MSDNELTAQQERAIDKIGKAIKQAEKLGLRFYGMSSRLTAYKNEPFEQGLVAEKHLPDSGKEVENWVVCHITDSSADDPWMYK